jgi:four helix bundle protein
MGNLIVGDVSLELVGALRPLVSRIKRQDRSLADQLVRAASSITLNISEADYSDPGNKRARLFTAAGSANEVRAAVKLAVRWQYVKRDDVSESKRYSTASSPCCGSSRIGKRPSIGSAKKDLHGGPHRRPATGRPATGTGTGDRNRRPGDRRPGPEPATGTGDRRPETGTGDRRPETGDRNRDRSRNWNWICTESPRSLHAWCTEGVSHWVDEQDIFGGGSLAELRLRRARLEDSDRVATQRLDSCRGDGSGRRGRSCGEAHALRVAGAGRGGRFGVDGGSHEYGVRVSV